MDSRRRHAVTMADRTVKGRRKWKQQTKSVTNALSSQQQLEGRYGNSSLANPGLGRSFFPLHAGDPNIERQIKFSRKQGSRFPPLSSSIGASSTLAAAKRHWSDQVKLRVSRGDRPAEPLSISDKARGSPPNLLLTACLKDED